MIFIYILYFAISIFTVWIAWYFRRFTLVDYQYNKSLQVKRRFVITLIYLAMLLQAMAIGGKRIFIYPTDNPWVISSACVFVSFYIFLLGRVEVPKRWKKKKRPFK